MSFRLHLLIFKAESKAINLSFKEDFALVAGQTAAGVLVLPTCSDASYLIPGGVVGLAYAPGLGRSGGRLDFLFGAPIVAVIVATRSELAPLPQLVVTPVAHQPPGDVVVSVLVSEKVLFGAHWQYRVELSFANGDKPGTVLSGGFTTPTVADMDVVALAHWKTYSELTAAGFYFS